MSSMLIPGLLLVLWLGARIGMAAANQRGAFRRGYCHGWYDAHHGDEWLIDQKTELFEDGTLPIVGSEGAER